MAILNRFDLLRQCFEKVHVPSGVYEEVVLQGAGLPGADETRAAMAAGWLRRVAAQNRIAVDALLAELDLGEAEAITLTRESGIGQVLLDDGGALFGLMLDGNRADGAGELRKARSSPAQGRRRN